jgi:hypothetical protein
MDFADFCLNCRDLSSELPRVAREGILRDGKLADQEGLAKPGHVLRP